MKYVKQSSVVLLTILLLTMPAVPRPSEAQEVEATAKIVLDAPSTARVGELVRLDASESTADSFRWVLVPESVDFEVYASGTKAVFSARAAGDYRFILAVAKDGTVDVVTYLIRVIGPPDRPSDELDVVGYISYWMWSVQASDDEKAALADAFDRVAVMGLGDAQAWIYETKRAVETALGDSKVTWEPFLKHLGGLMQQLGEAGDLVEPEDHIQIWKEIAQAIREN